MHSLSKHVCWIWTWRNRCCSNFSCLFQGFTCQVQLHGQKSILSRDVAIRFTRQAGPHWCGILKLPRKLHEDTDTRLMQEIPSLKLIASLHLKMDGWNTIVSFWDGLFSGVFAVSFRETSLTQEWIGNGIIVTIFAFNFNQRILVILHLRDWVRKHFNLISNMFRALMEINVFFTICI